MRLKGVRGEQCTMRCGCSRQAVGCRLLAAAELQRAGEDEETATTCQACAWSVDCSSSVTAHGPRYAVQIRRGRSDERPRAAPSGEQAWQLTSNNSRQTVMVSGPAAFETATSMRRLHQTPQRPDSSPCRLFLAQDAAQPACPTSCTSWSTSMSATFRASTACVAVPASCPQPLAR